MDRPSIRIKPDKLDKTVDVLNLIVLFFTVALPVFYFSDLPSLIPKHFNIKGIPDSYGSKYFIIILPFISVIFYIGCTVLKRYPHILNYPLEITNENAESQYHLAVKMIRFLLLILLSAFAYMTFATIQTAFDNSQGLGYFFIPVFVFLILFAITYFIYLLARKR
jgi:uncharacterized membrane protein